MQRLGLATPPSDRYSPVQRAGRRRQTCQGGWEGVLHSTSGCNGRRPRIGKGAGDGIGAPSRCVGRSRRGRGPREDRRGIEVEERHPEVAPPQAHPVSAPRRLVDCAIGWWIPKGNKTGLDRDGGDAGDGSVRGRALDAEGQGSLSIGGKDWERAMNTSTVCRRGRMRRREAGWLAGSQAPNLQEVPQDLHCSFQACAVTNLGNSTRCTRAGEALR
jgi:hypothetical protein